LFVATNTDSSFPGQGGVLFPGGGSIVHSVSVSSGRTPTVTGKPHSLILERICAKFSLDPQRTLMVGDRLETDILFGRRGQLRTLLVMTGITTVEHLRQSRLQPEFVAPSIAALIPNANQQS
jgi:ribonucleotide monophosphatase NagD (HAD superfamily)